MRLLEIFEITIWRNTNVLFGCRWNIFYLQTTRLRPSKFIYAALLTVHTSRCKYTHRGKKMLGGCGERADVNNDMVIRLWFTQIPPSARTGVFIIIVYKLHKKRSETARCSHLYIFSSFLLVRFTACLPLWSASETSSLKVKE